MPLPREQPPAGLTRTDDGWALLLGGGALSTHIVKLGAGPDTVAADVIHSEVAVLDLARLPGSTPRTPGAPLSTAPPPSW